MSYFISLFAVLALVILGLVGFLHYFLAKPAGGYDEGIVKIRENTFDVAVADTLVKRDRGLSGREPLLVNQGMYFIFPVALSYGFWMKEMNFPIDIVWIYKGQVFHAAAKKQQ